MAEPGNLSPFTNVLLYDPNRGRQIYLPDQAIYYKAGVNTDYVSEFTSGNGTSINGINLKGGGMSLTAPLSVTTAANDAIVINNTNASNAASSVSFQTNSTENAQVGFNASTNQLYNWTITAGDWKVGTNNAERLKILASGIANDNTVTNILGLQGTTLSYKNNIVDTTTAQTLTNKTIDSASNTVDVSGTNINTLINQAVTTSSSPTFTALTAGGLNVSSSNINNNSGNLGLQTNNDGAVYIGSGSSNNNALLFAGASSFGSQPTFLVPASSAQYILDSAAGDLVFYLTTGKALRFGFTNNQKSQLYVNSSGTFANNNVTLNSGASLFLPTSGGTSTALNYYEENLGTTTWSGIWASAQTGVTLNIVQIGKNVTITSGPALATANTASFISSSALPSRYWPPFAINVVIEISNNTVNSAGLLGIGTNGVMTVSPMTGNYTGSGVGGFYTFSVSYII